MRRRLPRKHIAPSCREQNLSKRIQSRRFYDGTTLATRTNRLGFRTTPDYNVQNENRVQGHLDAYAHDDSIRLERHRLAVGVLSQDSGYLAVSTKRCVESLLGCTARDKRSAGTLRLLCVLRKFMPGWWGLHGTRSGARVSIRCKCRSEPTSFHSLSLSGYPAGVQTAGLKKNVHAGDEFVCA